MPRPGASLLVLIGAGLLAGCGGGSRIEISVDRPVALWDAPLRIVVKGLKPSERARI
jgi:hypothetical protein